MADVSVVIPNWNGAGYLDRCISSLFEAFEVYPGNHEIIVVDNGSTDGSVALLRDRYPQVTIIDLGTNTGFGNACNEGIKHSSNGIVVLLNNDTYVKRDFLAPLVRHFEQKEPVFAVSCRLLDWETGECQLGHNSARFHSGLVEIRYTPDDSVSSCLPTFYAMGAACAIDRERFLEIGGFDRVMHRFSDVGLCYRAWKRGWKVLYEPQSVVFHKGMASDERRWGKRAWRAIKRRDMFLFIWQNVTDRRLITEHLLHLPLIFYRFGARTTLAGFLMALARLPSIIEHRSHEKGQAILTDTQILTSYWPSFQ